MNNLTLYLMNILFRHKKTCEYKYDLTDIKIMRTNYKIQILDIFGPLRATNPILVQKGGYVCSSCLPWCRKLSPAIFIGTVATLVHSR